MDVLGNAFEHVDRVGDVSDIDAGNGVAASRRGILTRDLSGMGESVASFSMLAPVRS
jgi:hypothetical protein